jgi:hypothetical protein
MIETRESIADAINSLKQRIKTDPLAIYWLNVIVENYESMTAKELAEKMVNQVFDRDSSIESFTVDVMSDTGKIVEVKAKRLK